MEYVLQHRNFGLGNFINLTPAIKWLYERRGAPVPVYFETDYVRECFQDWKAITMLDEPGEALLFGSHLVNPNNDIPDYQYAFHVVTGEKWTPEYHTYIDTPELTQREKEDWQGSIVIVNGSGSEHPNYVAMKNPGKIAYLDAINGNSGTKIIAVGSKADIGRSPWLKNIASEGYFGNIRTALKIISVAKMIIANDTGLAHAAGAMNKELYVLMKHTPRQRVKNPGINTMYLYSKKNVNWCFDDCATV